VTGKGAPNELNLTQSPIDHWIVGLEPSHTNNHVFGSDVCNEVPLCRFVALDFDGDFGFMSDSGGVECVICVIGVHGGWEWSYGYTMISDKGESKRASTW
jgi:hypothetical protein